MTLVRSRTHFKHLKKAFSTDSKVDPIIARLSVLYEDLRIEARGATENHLSPLDDNGVTYRQMYFVRRSTVTLQEFIGAFTMLDRLPQFADIKKQFQPDSRKAWEEAKSFFQTHVDLITAIRHATGGHFKHGTGETVVQELHPETYERLEVVLDHAKRRGGPRLRYANEFIAIALQVEKRETESSNEYYARIFEAIWTAWQHAVLAMNAVVTFYVLPRFE